MLINLAYRLLRVYWFLVRPITMGTRILLIKDDQVVLVKHTYQDAWYIPGGGIKRNESIGQAVRREAAEECGATINQMRFLGFYTNFVNYKNDHIALFFSDDFSMDEKHDHEIEQVAVFPIRELPEKISHGSRRKIEAFIDESLESTGIW